MLDPNHAHFSKLRNAIEFERFDGSNEAVRLLEAGDEGAGLFSRLMFCWVNPLIMKGYLGELNEARKANILIFYVNRNL